MVLITHPNTRKYYKYKLQQKDHQKTKTNSKTNPKVDWNEGKRMGMIFLRNNNNQENRDHVDKCADHRKSKSEIVQGQMPGTESQGGGLEDQTLEKQNRNNQQDTVVC